MPSNNNINNDEKVKYILPALFLSISSSMPTTTVPVYIAPISQAYLNTPFSGLSKVDHHNERERENVKSSFEASVVNATNQASKQASKQTEIDHILCC
jgi:hypothetical protein